MRYYLQFQSHWNFNGLKKWFANEKFKINVHNIELDLKYKYNAKYMQLFCSKLDSSNILSALYIDIYTIFVFIKNIYTCIFVTYHQFRDNLKK